MTVSWPTGDFRPPESDMARLSTSIKSYLVIGTCNLPPVIEKLPDTGIGISLPSTIDFIFAADGGQRRTMAPAWLICV
eukprot:CAMPEP_0178492690 /NCGR_PEP_ID=MMETSP0696-20121128/12072_1 /TAXON_ID=265572 /ORGANISM="Extubocellulus spinifer, Strain CCMP396" /LENGTH=77 /DNA_ID=CAMNT_0020120631 /DNA_START=51 /DNA_END=285 /DNA_ORIENTATION=-